MLAASLPSETLRSNKGITQMVLRVKTNTGMRAFHSCTTSIWNNLLLSVHSAISTTIFRNVSNASSLWLGLSTIDVPDGPLILRKCRWTVSRLSQHCHRLRRGYWCYWNFIDWLISTWSPSTYISLLIYPQKFLLFGTGWTNLTLSRWSHAYVFTAAH